MELEGKRKITPEKAQQILRQNGLTVTTQEAGQILDFLYKLANFAIKQFLKNENR